MTKKIMKTLAVAMCAVLLVAGSIAGTMAYLTSTAKVENTFTAGKVAITMDEAKVNAYGEPVKEVEGVETIVALNEAPRVTDNEYKLIPGRTYVKDPIIHVAQGSEECYLFVKVENGISAIESVADSGTSVDAQLRAKGWIPLSGDVYYHENAVDARTTAKDIPVFETFTIREDADVAAYATATNNTAKITVTAYAVQADGFDTAQAAWGETFGA